VSDWTIWLNVQFSSRFETLIDKFNYAFGNRAQKTSNSGDTIPIRPAANQILRPQNTTILLPDGDYVTIIFK
jgi:hypothetical protein